MAQDNPLHELAARGQSIWFDTLSRQLVHSGELKKMMKDDAVTGVTSNPSIFQKALSEGDAYDEQMKELLAQTDDAHRAGALAAFAHGRAASLMSKIQVRGYTLDDVLAVLPGVWTVEVPAPRPPLLAELPAVGEHG